MLFIIIYINIVITQVTIINKFLILSYKVVVISVFLNIDVKARVCIQFNLLVSSDHNLYIIKDKS